MQIVRTLVWVLVTAALVAFMAMNWHRAPVNIWPLQGSYLFFEWPVGVIALVFFLLGLGPMWLLHLAGRWRWQRRVSALENSVRATSTTASTLPPPPLATSTQLEKHEPAPPPA